jgi:predicted DNA-binding ribbon-helix-helix protein
MQGGYPMKSSIAKRSVIITGHKTSISLEDAFWTEMKMIASKRDMTLSKLVSSLDRSREHGNLSSAIRLFVLGYYTNDAERQPLHHTAAVCASGGRLKAPAL